MTRTAAAGPASLAAAAVSTLNSLDQGMNAYAAAKTISTTAAIVSSIVRLVATARLAVSRSPRPSASERMVSRPSPIPRSSGPRTATSELIVSHIPYWSSLR